MPAVSAWWHWIDANSTSSPLLKTGAKIDQSGRCPPPWYGSLHAITSPSMSPSRPKNSRANRIGPIELNMNCGTPTSRAARRPCSSRMVALRSLDWLRIGVVAVKETCVAISNAIVSSAPRMTSAVTGSIFGFVARFGACFRRIRSFVVAMRSASPAHVRAELVELHGPSRRDHDRREALLDDGRSLHPLARAELRAVVDRGLPKLPVEELVAA